MRRGIIQHRRDRILLNPVRTELDPGQEKPPIFRQLDTADFHSVEMLTYLAKSMPERVADRLLGRFTYAAFL